MAARRRAFLANSGFDRLESLIMTGKPVIDALKALDNGPVQLLDRHGASILASSRRMRFACRNDSVSPVGRFARVTRAGSETTQKMRCCPMKSVAETDLA